MLGQTLRYRQRVNDIRVVVVQVCWFYFAGLVSLAEPPRMGIAGLMGYLGQVAIDWQLTVSFTFAAALGTLLGAYLARFVSAQQLQKGFGYFLLVVAGFILFQNRHSFERTQPTQSSLPVRTIRSSR